MADLPFVSAKHVPKLALQRAALETSDVRLTYPFQRSTTDAVFSGFDSGKLYSALIYIMFDLFPNARFGADLSPQYLVQYIYDRMRFLLIELRKIDQRADELFLPFATLLSEYQKSLYNAASFEQIHELYQATNNWLFLRDNVYLNTNIRSSFNLQRIERLEAQNDQERLKELALNYFRSGDALVATEALHALGRVRLASAVGGFACADVSASRVSEILQVYSFDGADPSSLQDSSDSSRPTDRPKPHSLSLRTRTRWAACEMYLSDPAFSFLRSRAFIVNETQKQCHLLYNIAQRARYDKSAAWGFARPLVPQNPAHRDITVVPVELRCKRPLEVSGDAGQVGEREAPVSTVDDGWEANQVGGNERKSSDEGNDDAICAVGGIGESGVSKSAAGADAETRAQAKAGQAVNASPGLPKLPGLELDALAFQAPERTASGFAFGAVSTARPQLQIDAGSSRNNAAPGPLNAAPLQVLQNGAGVVRKSDAEASRGLQAETAKWAFNFNQKPADANPSLNNATYGVNEASKNAAKPYTAFLPSSTQNQPAQPLNFTTKAAVGTFFQPPNSAPEHGASADASGQQKQFNFALNGAALGAFQTPAQPEQQNRQATWALPNQQPQATQAASNEAVCKSATPQMVPAPTAENKQALRQLIRELKKQYITEVIEESFAQRRHERRLREMVASLHAEEQALASVRASQTDEPAAKPSEFASQRSQSAEFGAIASEKPGFPSFASAVHLEVINRFWPLPDVLK